MSRERPQEHLYSTQSASERLALTQCLAHRYDLGQQSILQCWLQDSTFHRCQLPFSLLVDFDFDLIFHPCCFSETRHQVAVFFQGNSCLCLTRSTASERGSVPPCYQFYLQCCLPIAAVFYFPPRVFFDRSSFSCFLQVL